MINTEHMVGVNQVSKQPSVKTQILLANTSSTITDYFTKISTRWNGNYDGSFTYTVAIDGQIYQHFSPLHYTILFNEQKVDSQIISIGLENVGWLTRNDTSGVFFDWKGNIYEGEVHGKLWRGHSFWANYTQEQINSMLELIKLLTKEFHIKSNFSGTNLTMDDVVEFKGVVNRGNYGRYYYDLSPAALPFFDHIHNSIKNM